MTKTTLVILKPDCVSRGLIGQVTQRLEHTGLKMTGSKMLNLSTEILKEHYAHIADKPFFPEVLSYMQSAPVMVQLWTGDNAVAIIRKNIGVTDPLEAKAWTIRGDYALTINHNIIHASEDEEQAANEVKRFFDDSELVSYN